MSKEKINSRGIQLSEKNIFGSSQWYDLTSLGSCLEGICSVQDYLKQASNNGGMSDDKREEWGRDIEDRFSRAEGLMGVEMSKSEHDVLLNQYRVIVEGRMALLTKLPTLVTRS